jgi:lipid II:glycine glycyltransferase (peptidoglycan interpeptide bridge formation enzyme)
MPTLNVEENIKRLEQTLEELTQEVFRVQGSLRVFKGFQETGLKEVEIPEKKKEVEEEQVKEK